MKSILIIRLGAIGDIVMASPMIQTLRKAYSEAYIVWLAEPAAWDLLRHNPGLDEVICWPKAQWKELAKQGRLITLASEIRRFASKMRKQGFDLALDAQGLLKSRFIAWLSGARRRVGFESREPGQFLMTKIISRGPNSDYMGSEYYYLMKVLGLAPKPFRPSVAVFPRDERFAENKIRQLGVVGGYAVLCPFTTRPQKHWLEERWAALGMAIEERLGLHVIVLGGPGDINSSRRIQSLTQNRIRNLSGTVSLIRSAAIIKKADLMVGVDTGLTHMGAAFNCPTVALFGATCPYLCTANSHTAVLYHNLPCSPCKRRPTCDGKFTCMKSIQVEAVFNAARELLKQSKTRSCISST